MPLIFYALAFVINYLDDCNIRREREKLVLSNYNSLNTQIKINDSYHYGRLHLT